MSEYKIKILISVLWFSVVVPGLVFATNDVFKVDSSTNARLLTVQNNGYVGIGTTTPFAQLSVQATAGGTNPLFVIASSTSGTGTSTAFYVAANGKVGIGTASPSSLFHVNSATAIGTYSRFTNSNTGTTASDGSVFGIEPGGLTTFWNYENQDMLFGTKNAEVMRIKNTGNVGIGTSSPSQRLSVAGSVLADSYIEYSPAYVGDALSKIKSISAESASLKSGSDWAKIDHASLPDGVRVEQRIKNPAVDYYATTTDDNGKDIVEHVVKPAEDYLFVGRDLGNSVQFNLRAIQQLLEKVELLEARVKVLEGNIK